MNFSTNLNKRALTITIVSAIVFTSVFIVLIFLAHNYDTKASSELSITIPENWNKNYSESMEDYLFSESLDEEYWETLSQSEESFITVDLVSSGFDASFSGTATVNSSLTLDDETIIMLPENDAWRLISNDLFKGYPTGSFNQNKSTLVKIQQSNTETIKVKCWYWEDPNDNTNFNKVTVEKLFAVNSAIAPLFIHAFEDIYNDPSQPVINIADRGMGTWVLRGKNHNNNASLSTHSLGCCIDINPSTGSFKVNGKWYGNAYGHNTMSYEMWQALPECHNKYHVLYDGSPIVEIFKSYGFVWGGDWSSTKDVMHLSFIGEGKNCRELGQQNYLQRK